MVGQKNIKTLKMKTEDTIAKTNGMLRRAVQYCTVFYCNVTYYAIQYQNIL